MCDTCKFKAGGGKGLLHVSLSRLAVNWADFVFVVVVIRSFHLDWQPY